MRKKNEKKLMDDMEKVGYKMGYNCMGPATSLLAGEGSSNALRLLLNAPGCYSNFKKAQHLVDNNSEINPKLQSALGELHVASGMYGCCQFWKDYRFQVDKECANAEMDIQKARESCLKAFSNS